MGKKKPEKLSNDKGAKKHSESVGKEDYKKFLDDKMKEFFEIIDNNIDVFKRLKDK